MNRKLTNYLNAKNDLLLGLGYDQHIGYLIEINTHYYWRVLDNSVIYSENRLDIIEYTSNGATYIQQEIINKECHINGCLSGVMVVEGGQRVLSIFDTSKVVENDKSI